jgi:hypothetical protein
MPYRNRINTLSESLRLIGEQIKLLETSNADSAKIIEMKQQKIIYTDELRRLEKLQWENDHETIDYGDDR